MSKSVNRPVLKNLEGIGEVLKQVGGDQVVKYVRLTAPVSVADQIVINKGTGLFIVEVCNIQI